MPSIRILEQDATSAGVAAASTDVVYVPGLAETNRNYLIYTTAGDAPTANTAGTIATEDATSSNINKRFYVDTTLGLLDEDQLADLNGKLSDYTAAAPQYACNIVDKVTYKCTAKSDENAYTWEAQKVYIEPHPENVPTLCSTLADFEFNFGKAPYRFEDDQAYPKFDPVVTSPMYVKGEYEKSYIYAKELISRGIPVIYNNIVLRQSNLRQTPSVSYLYAHLVDGFNELKDVGEYSVKYITSGAYPTFEFSTDQEGDVGLSLVNVMTTVAKERGDAVAIIDHTNNPARALDATSGSGSVYDKLLSSNISYPEFGTMFTPWASYTCTTAPNGFMTQIMPASFNYLICLADAIHVNNNWVAMAGVSRGVGNTIQALNTIPRLSNIIADAYQPRDAVALNAITNIKPYGLTIWGNRTLSKNSKGNLTALSFLNVRNLVSDVKKVAYRKAKEVIYEQDSEITWLKFKSGITPLLDQMRAGFGLQAYKIIRATTKYDGTPLAKGEMAAVIRLIPIYALEDIEVTCVIEDGEVSVS